MADKEERRRQLEEKRKRLEDLRKRKAQGASTSAAAAPSQAKTSPAPAAAKEKKVDSTEVSDLVSSLIDTTPAATATVPAPSAIDDAPPAGSPEAKKNVQLSFSTFISELNIPPKVTESYTKTTQTAEQVAAARESDDESAPPAIEVTAAVTSTLEAEADHAAAGTPTDAKDTAEEVRELSAQEKKDALGSTEFNDFFSRASRFVERALTETVDYAADYTMSGSGDEDGPKHKESVSHVSKFYDDRWSKHRSVTDMQWSPRFPELFVASYNSRGGEQLKLGDSLGDPDGVVLVWNVNMDSRPEFVFHCQSAVMTTKFQQFQPNLIIGGTYSGQIVLWDTRAKSTPVQRTPLSSQGHTHPVYSLSVVGTENAHNLVTTSTDGRMCVWTLGMLTQPQEVMSLKQLKHNKDVAVTTMAFPADDVNCCFVGSEEGSVYQVFRHGSKEGVNQQYDGHYGPVLGMDFHPASDTADISDLLLTSAADWTVKLWSQKQQKFLYSFEEADDYVYDVKWSPAHPSLFAAADGSGCFDLWNLVDDTEVPIIHTEVGNKALNKISWSGDGNSLLTGDSVGAINLFKIAKEVSQPKADDSRRLEELLNEMRS